MTNQTWGTQQSLFPKPFSHDQPNIILLIYLLRTYWMSIRFPRIHFLGIIFPFPNEDLVLIGHLKFWFLNVSKHIDLRILNNFPWWSKWTKHDSSPLYINVWHLYFEVLDSNMIFNKIYSNFIKLQSNWFDPFFFYIDKSNISHKLINTAWTCPNIQWSEGSHFQLF